MESRQPGFAPTQADNTGWVQREDEFIQRDNALQYQVTGIVADCLRVDRHYSRLYRFFRSIIYGEPFQLRKSGKNMYGASSIYTALRIIPQSGGEAISVLCCGECGLIAAGDEVTLLVSRSRNGDYLLKSGVNQSTNARISRDPLAFSATSLRVLAAMTVLLMLLLIIWLANGGISQIVSGFFAVITWLLTTLWRVFGVTVIVLLGILFLVKSLFK